MKHAPKKSCAATKRDGTACKLGGKTLGAAAIEELRHALNRRHRMAANFNNTPGLVSSIVKYKKEAKYANQ